jgi:hypothetical protein
LLDFLNQNSGALTVIFAAVVMLSTVVYAVLTAFLVAETRRMRRAQTEPKVEVFIKHREEWINLIHAYVRNIGLGPAYKISFDISAESGGEGAQALIDDFTKANFFKTGLKYLGPGQEQISGFSQMTEKFDQKIESVLVFDVRYEGATGKQYQEKFRLDFSEFKGRSQIGKPHLYAIAKHLETIKSDIHNLATGFKRIKADVFDSEDRDRERKEWEEHHAEVIDKSKESAKNGS